MMKDDSGWAQPLPRPPRHHTMTGRTPKPEFHLLDLLIVLSWVALVAIGLYATWIYNFGSNP